MPLCYILAGYPTEGQHMSVRLATKINRVPAQKSHLQ
jgi:hypothetical protein